MTTERVLTAHARESALDKEEVEREMKEMIEEVQDILDHDGDLEPFDVIQDVVQDCHLVHYHAREFVDEHTTPEEEKVAVKYLNDNDYLSNIRTINNLYSMTAEYILIERIYEEH